MSSSPSQPASSAGSSVSARMQEVVALKSLLWGIYFKWDENKYEEGKNEQGIINLSTAQNTSLLDMITEKLNQEDLRTWEPSMLPYRDEICGLVRLRKAIVKFLSEQFTTKELDPDKVLIVSSAVSTLSMLAFALCDPGDTVLAASPIYGSIPFIFFTNAGVKTFTFPLSSKCGADGTKPYEMTTQFLEDALKEAQKRGHKVKAFLLINPGNPLGTVYTREQVLDYLGFCKRHDLHCIIDEIYGSSVYDRSVEFTSVLALDPEELPDKNKTHVVYGLAKDFGMPGNPTGLVYTWNEELRRGLGKLVPFHQIAVFNQISVAKLLEDREWIQTKYLPANHKRLDELSKITMATLDELGVPYIKPSAGLFIWADFSKYLSEATFEAEYRLADHFIESGISVPQGAAFFAGEPGWFRIVFSHPTKLLVESMRRLKEACASFSG